MRMNFEDYKNRPFSKKYELKDLTPANINKLLKDKLFEKVGPLNYSPNIEDSTRFESILYINSMEYRINNIVLKEIYNTLRFLIEELNNLEYWEINIIEANIDARYTNDDKIEYLKEKRKELYLSIQDQPEYYVYIGKRDFNGFDNWEDYMFEVLANDENTIIKYLTNDLQIPDIPEEIYNDWLKYYKMTEVINLCENKINELALKKTDDSIEKIEEEKIEKNNNNFSSPRSIAMLQEIGFFELEKIKNLNETSKHKILAVILRKDPENKNVLREIRGNINVLKDYSSEDGTKFTSHKHINNTKIFIEKLK